MMIKYSGTNVHAMAHINEAALKSMKDGDAKAIAIQTPQDVKWLRPGWNEFPRATWEQNKEHPEIKKMLKKKVIELMEYEAKIKIKDPKTGRPKTVTRMVGADDKPVKLKWFDEITAKKIVTETLNRDMLQRWMDEETRHKVKKVLRKQIEPLMNNNKDDDDIGDDFEDEELE
jgi:hypothetical protein